MPEDKTILERTWKNFRNLEQLASVDLQDGRFSVCIDDGRFECLLFRRGEPRLFVLLSGRRDPFSQSLPKFDRWSWHRKFPGTVICISDPTLYLAPDHLKIGWYVGTSAKDWMTSLADLVLTIAEKLGVACENIVSYGSSGGGFASLMLACRLGPATGVAINPQIFVLDYSRRFVDEFLEIAFENRAPEQLGEEEKKRLSVVAAFKEAAATKYVIVQNTLDRVHYVRHFGKFCKTIGINPSEAYAVQGRVRTILYSSPNGHGGEPREMVADIIKAALQKFGEGTGRLELTDIRLADVQKKEGFIIKAEHLYFPGSEQDAPSLDSNEIIFAPHGRTDVEHVKMSLPIDWNLNPFNDSNWCAQLQKWNMIDRYILAYEASNDRRYLQKPKEIMMDWYRHHVEMGIESQMAWKDFIVGMRAMKIAHVVSQCLHGRMDLTKDEEAIYLHLIKLHLDLILDPRNIKFTNHTFFDIHGGMALTKVIDSGHRKSIKKFLLDLVPKLIASQFDRYGVHLEHSFGYQAFGIGCLQRLARSGWFDSVNVKETIATAEEVQRWFYLPDGRVAPIGDTSGQQSPKIRKQVVFSGTRQVFNTSGYCIIRSDGNREIINASYFCLMGAFHSKIHKHADDLSVIWFEGEDILCDPGKFAYKSHEGRKYVQSTRAHNTVEIDESDYSVENEDAYGSAIRDVSVRDWGYLIVASVNHKKFDVRHTRFCLYKTGNWIVIIDKLISNRTHQFTQWHHFNPHLNITQTKRGFFTKLSNDRSLNIVYAASGGSVVQLVSGETKPRMQGWVSQGYAKLSPSQTLGICQSGTDVIFATLFCIDDEGSRLSIKPNGRIMVDLRYKKGAEPLQIVAGNHSCRVLSIK
jgi:hypothetical protein